MPRGTSAKGYRCRTCGERFGSFPALGFHAKAHRAAERATASAPTIATGRRRKIADLGGAAALADDAGARPPAPAEIDGSGPSAPAAPPSAAPSRPTVAAPSIRISPEQRAASVSDAVRDALPIATVADILVALSRSLSDIDGAGEAGVLSPIQATQVASLLYDATIDLVVTRFGGDVTRFKAGLAVLIVLLSKGTVHAKAIGRKVQEGRLIARARAQEAALLGAQEAPADAEPADVFEAARAREERLRATLAGS